MRVPPWAWVGLWRPDVVQARLDALAARGEAVPTLFQVWIGVLYMWARVLRRPETIGLSDGEPVRDTPGARRLRHRLLRLAAVLRHRVVNPLDQTGLGSSEAHIVRHLLGAYHPGRNLLYDLAILSLHDGALERLAAGAQAVVDGSDPCAELRRDLVVYEGYHERLLAAVEAWLREGPPPTESHPDTTLPAFLAWCRQAPAGPRDALRQVARGELRLMP